MRLSKSRCGFTLVELLVAIGLLLILATLALSIIPNVSQSQNTTRAAGQLQQWIEIAKSRAARDRAPRGIRLIAQLSATKTAQVIQLEYIEMPGPYTLHGFSSVTGLMLSSTATVPGGTNSVTFSSNTKTLSGGLGAGNFQLWPVQAGDYIDLGGVAYQIVSLQSDTQLTLAPKVPATIVTSNYKIIRQPRPIGDDLLEMPQNIIIDLAKRNISGGRWDLPINPLLPLDIMFAPDGRVMPSMGNGSTSYDLVTRDKIILWVRDATLPDGEGDPTLVVIYPRTGLIAAQPVDVDYLTTSPYTFTTSGQRSSE